MTTRPLSPSESLLTPAEVASLFRVDPKTVTRWAKSGKLSSIRTLGGHRRYRAAEVRELLGAGDAAPEVGADSSSELGHVGNGYLGVDHLRHRAG